MSVVSRETVRDGLVTLLGALVSAGTVQEVIGHRASDLEGKTPLVAVLSEGSLRTRMTFQGTRPTFYLTVQSWVLAEDATGYTEADAEDKLDLIEQSIAGLLETNQKTAYWDAIGYGERTQVEDVAVGGHAYFLETMAVEVRVMK